MSPSYGEERNYKNVELEIKIKALKCYVCLSYAPLLHLLFK